MAKILTTLLLVWETLPILWYSRPLQLELISNFESEIVFVPNAQSIMEVSSLRKLGM